MEGERDCGSDAVDRARSHLRGGPCRAGVRHSNAREQPRDGEAGVRAGIGTQSELRRGSPPVRALFFNGPAGSSSRVFRKSAWRSTSIRCRLYVVLILGAVCARPAGWTTLSKHFVEAVQLDPESFVARWMLGVSLERLDDSKGGPTLQTALGLSRRAPRAPSQAWPLSSGTGGSRGGDCAAWRTAGPRLTLLCSADLPCSCGRGFRAT